MNNQNIISPLDKTLLNRFIILEEKILNNKYDMNEVQELIEIYSVI